MGSVTAERVGCVEVGEVTRRVKMAPSKPWAACEAHRAYKATCCVFSMNERIKQSFPLAAPPNCMFIPDLVPERIDLVRDKTR